MGCYLLGDIASCLQRSLHALKSCSCPFPNLNPWAQVPAAQLELPSCRWWLEISLYCNWFPGDIDHLEKNGCVQRWTLWDYDPLQFILIRINKTLLLLNVGAVLVNSHHHIPPPAGGTEGPVLEYWLCWAIKPAPIPAFDGMSHGCDC